MEQSSSTLNREIPPDFPKRVKQLRDRFGLTQVRLAELMGVSFASVNRWENGQARPSAMAWPHIIRAEMLGLEALRKHSVGQSTAYSPTADGASKLENPPGIDFSADPEIVRVIAEGERLTYGHLFNPSFATEISLIDPLPHQRLKDFPYYCLWRLLEPEVLSTVDAFHDYPVDARQRHFIRRTKEAMVRFDGSPIYPTRLSDTLSYELTQGRSASSGCMTKPQTIFSCSTTGRVFCNRAAARMAMSIFQLPCTTRSLCILASRSLSACKPTSAHACNGGPCKVGCLWTQQPTSHICSISH
jgi:transcriptional regulator with XRE-family HTH domain